MTVSIIPPALPEFRVYGDAVTNAAARAWATLHRYVLVAGVAECPHGLIGLTSCPSNCGALLDHANIWAPETEDPSEPGRIPFVLAHNYDNPKGLPAFADAWGLALDHDDHDGAGWYGHGTTPARLTPSALHGVWPLERELLALFARPMVFMMRDPE